jgi:hypothetical protein
MNGENMMLLTTRIFSGPNEEESMSSKTVSRELYQDAYDSDGEQRYTLRPDPGWTFEADSALLTVLFQQGDVTVNLVLESNQAVTYSVITPIHEIGPLGRIRFTISATEVDSPL